jgi:predicted lysophospholipase L1 biosynthesis ABC-type transport system permease subunit
MHLPDLIDLGADPVDPVSTETVDAINVRLEGAAPRDVEAFGEHLAARVPGLIVRSTAGDEGRAAPFVVLERFHLAIAIVTVFAASIFLLALMLMLVDERRQTVGILRLIGYRRGRILLYLFVEGLIITAAGAALGIVIAVALQGGVNRFFQWRYDTALVFVRITPRIAARSIAIAVPLGLAAAVGASWSLLRRDVLSLTRR